MLAFLRVVKYAFQDLGRNIGLSFMTVFILVLMLLSVNILWSVNILTDQAVKAVKNEINASLYFTAATTDKDIQEVKEYLGSFDEVENITVLDKDTVLNNFKTKYADNTDVLSALNELGDNPFGPTMIIKTKEPEDYQKIMAALDMPEYKQLIESKSYEGQEGAIQKLQNITNRIEQTGAGLSILFAIIAFMVIFNTIRVAINSQRAEIGIKRLVGASNWFIRGPYLVESLIFSVISVAIAFGVIFLALHYLDAYLTVVFSGAFSLTNYFKSNILWLFGCQFAAVLLLNIVSSLLAMRRQLKV